MAREGLWGLYSDVRFSFIEYLWQWLLTNYNHDVQFHRNK